MKNKVVFINDSEEAPINATFLLRSLQDGTVVLEKYPNYNKVVLKEFPVTALASQEDFKVTLKKVRKIIGHSTLYVQKPGWMYIEKEFEMIIDAMNILTGYPD